MVVDAQNFNRAFRDIFHTRIYECPFCSAGSTTEIVFLCRACWPVRIPPRCGSPAPSSRSIRNARSSAVLREPGAVVFHRQMQCVAICSRAPLPPFALRNASRNWRPLPARCAPGCIRHPAASPLGFFSSFNFSRMSFASVIWRAAFSMAAASPDVGGPAAQPRDRCDAFPAGKCPRPE